VTSIEQIAERIRAANAAREREQFEKERSRLLQHLSDPDLLRRLTPEPPTLDDGEALPIPDNITPDTPLPLEMATRIAFPNGTMTVSGLRNEIRKGTLQASKIAGRIFVTLAGITRMIEQCRITEADENTRVRNSISGTPNDPAAQSDGSSWTAPPTVSASSAAQAHLNQIAQRLKKPSPDILPKSTSPTSAKVVPIKS
jgi:hypothetical protein